jgi:hypothetical protein
VQLRASNIGPSVKLSYPVVSTDRNTKLQTLEGTHWLNDSVSKEEHFLKAYILGD